MRVHFIGVSKFQDLLKQRRDARVFSSVSAQPWRIDIVFFDALREVRVCPATALFEYSLVVNGEPAAVGSTAEVFFAAGDRMLVLSSDQRARDAIQGEFGLRVPAC